MLLNVKVQICTYKLIKYVYLIQIAGIQIFMYNKNLKKYSFLAVKLPSNVEETLCINKLLC